MKFTIPFLIADGEVDSTFERFAPGGVTCPDEVPVVLDFIQDVEHTLGKVTVRREGDTFIGDFEIYDELLFKHEPDLIGYYYPAVYGYASETNTLDGGVKEITKCTVHGVALSHTRNTDSRIKRIKDVK